MRLFNALKAHSSASVLAALSLCILLASCSAPTNRHQHNQAERARTPDTSHQANNAQRARPVAEPIGNSLQQANLDPQQFLNRVTWGVNASSTQALQAMGIDAYLAQQLGARGPILPSAIQTQIDNLSITQRPFAQMMVELENQREIAQKEKGTDDTLRKAYQQELTRIAREGASRSVLRAVYSSNQLYEQMVWFWLNHFNISNQKNNVRAMLADFDEQAIRPYALGNFRDLLRATLIHPAMLRYLDNEHNAANRINENYARELMELHTMGVGSGYSQRDVQELARVLTGVGINLSNESSKVKPDLRHLAIRQGLFEFNPNRHDFGSKQLLGQTIQGRGFDEVEQVLTLLTRQPATAHFVSNKLALFFVSDTPSETLVNAMAQRFLATDGDIPSVLRVLFTSQEFFASLGGKFKDPVHYVFSSVRLAYDGSTIINTGPILNWLNTLGQQYGGRQTPDGYALVESAWASPGQLTNRFDVAKAIGGGSPNLFKPEGQEKSPNPRDFPRPSIDSSAFVRTWIQHFSKESQQAISQAGSPAEWNAFFLSSPEMMRR